MTTPGDVGKGIDDLEAVFRLRGSRWDRVGFREFLGVEGHRCQS
jgi:hypothetical protein